MSAKKSSKTFKYAITSLLDTDSVQNAQGLKAMLCEMLKMMD